MGFNSRFKGLMSVENKKMFVKNYLIENGFYNTSERRAVYSQVKVKQSHYSPGQAMRVPGG